MKRKMTTILLSLAMIIGLFAPKISASANTGGLVLGYYRGSPAHYIMLDGMMYYDGDIVNISQQIDFASKVELSGNGFWVYVDGTSKGGDPGNASGSLSSPVMPGRYTVNLSYSFCLEIKFVSMPADPPAPDGDSSGYYIDPLVDDIAIAAEYSNGEEATVTWDAGDSLPLEIMKQLQDNPNIELDFSFTYEGVQHRVLIPAGKAIVDEEITWYGPLWLIKMYGEYDGKKTSEYTVVSGDTLGGLAKKWGTTVDELMKLNPDIKDRDKIYPGDTIVH